MVTYVYFIRSGAKKKCPIKIGVASDVSQRIRELQTGNPTELSLIAAIPCDSRKHAYSVESTLHRRFSRQHVRGEWFTYRINLSSVKNILREAILDQDEEDARHRSDAWKITTLRAKVKSLEKTIKFQDEEINDLLARLTADYEFKSY